RRDRHRRRALLPRPRRAAAPAELGQHDSAGPAVALGAAHARAVAERGAVRHRPVVQLARRAAALALERAVSARDRPPLLAARDLEVACPRGGGAVTAVRGLCYELESGRTLAIIGESGCGKTVACRALLKLLPRGASITGSVRLEGRELLGLT